MEGGYVSWDRHAHVYEKWQAQLFPEDSVVIRVHVFV